MITYLHHTDPIMPHYRGKEWNFQRGAAATVDRPFLGWQGRFFLHDVAHYHVIHHVRLYFLSWQTSPNKTNQFFPKMPFCGSCLHCCFEETLTNSSTDHGPEATQHLKAFIGDHYVSSDAPAFKALWENYNKCQFVEDEGKTPSFCVSRMFPNCLVPGDVIFYRDKKGQAIRRPADKYRVNTKAQ